MKRLLYLVLILGLLGCSQSAPTVSTNPQVAPTFSSPATIETVSQVGDEIFKRHPPQTNPTSVQVTQVVLDILDNAESDKTTSAVKDWAIQGSRLPIMGVNASPTRSEAAMNTFKWIGAAADSKKAMLSGSSSSSEYETNKKNALSEAARADSIPVH